MNTNYYTILGLSKDATQEQIKKAYRQKAKEFHPDINKAPDAQDRMKEVNVAYDVLSDPQKKQQYDYGQTNPNQTQYGGYTHTQGQGQGFNDPMFEEIFRQFYQQANSQQQYRQSQRRVFNPFGFFFKIMIFMYVFDFIIYILRLLLF